MFDWTPRPLRWPNQIRWIQFENTNLACDLFLFGWLTPGRWHNPFCIVLIVWVWIIMEPGETSSANYGFHLPLGMVHARLPLSLSPETSFWPLSIPYNVSSSAFHSIARTFTFHRWPHRAKWRWPLCPVHHSRQRLRRISIWSSDLSPKKKKKREKKEEETINERAHSDPGCVRM